MNNNRNKGFTLVELAIVLVIIGLLVGGVLQGQELIKQAQIRSVITTIGQYDTAVNTFRSKYDNGLPGDFQNAVAFGLNSPNAFNTAVGATYNGDGDGQLESQAATPSASATFNGEIANFFIALGNTGLVKGVFSAVAGTTIDTDSEFPSLPVGTGFVAVSAGGNLYYMLGLNNAFGNGAIFNAASGNAASSPLGVTLTPEEAYAIDSKLDNGTATTGIVQSINAYSGLAANPLFAVGGATCNDTTTGVYVLSTTTGTCSIRVRASS